MICSFHVKFDALRYKPEGCGFDFRLCRWDFLLTQSFWPHYDPGVKSPSNRNEYQEYFLMGKGGRCVGLTSLPPSCANYLEMWSLSILEPSGPVQACNGIALYVKSHSPNTFYLNFFTVVPAMLPAEDLSCVGCICKLIFTCAQKRLCRRLFA
jgi:hypothetical protein